MKKLRHREFANSPNLAQLVSNRQDSNPGSPASESHAYLLHCTGSSNWDKQGHLGVGEGHQKCHTMSPLTHVHPGDSSSARPLRPGGRPSSCLSSTLSICIRVGRAERARGWWASFFSRAPSVGTEDGRPDRGRSRLDPGCRGLRHRQEGRGRAGCWNRGPTDSQSRQEHLA